VADELPGVLAIYPLFGIAQGTINPISNTAVSGMPASMAGVAASVGWQTGTTLGVEHGVWWLVLGLGVGIVVVGLLSTGRLALGSARRAAALFDGAGMASPGPGLLVTGWPGRGRTVPARPRLRRRAARGWRCRSP
jgi:hypothetical protein